MLNDTAFVDKIIKSLKQHYGEAFVIEKNMITKNNGVTYVGLTITSPDSNIAPTIYMEELYQHYMEGTPLSEIVQIIQALYEKYKIEKKIDVSYFTDFNYLKDFIFYKLINYKDNEEMLKDMPHVRFLDMAVVFYCHVKHEELGEISLSVRKHMCSLWGVSEKQLLELAKENTPREYPVKIENIQKYLQNYCSDNPQSDNTLINASPIDAPLIDTPPIDTVSIDTASIDTPEADATLFDAPPIYVVSNEQNLYGAATILYPGVLEQFAQEEESDCIILPSSIHEVLLIPVKHITGDNDYDEMIRQINATELKQQDILSDHAYYYDYCNREIRTRQFT